MSLYGHGVPGVTGLIHRPGGSGIGRAPDKTNSMKDTTNMHLLTVVMCAPFVASAIKEVSRFLKYRRCVRDKCKEELQALNSPSVIHGPGLDVRPPIATFDERAGNKPSEFATTVAAFKRRQHHYFCAKWARAAKARFHFAQMCEDTALSRAALHRYFLAEWKQLKIPLHHMDLFMLDCIELSLEPTSEYHSTMSKRKQRKQARMEYYNERRALAAIR